MQFKATIDKQIILSGLNAETIDHAVDTIGTFLSAFNIKTINSMFDNDICIIYLDNNSKMVVSQDKIKLDEKIDNQELIALIQKDEEINKIICSTIKKSSRRATKASDAVRRKFSGIKGKFKSKTIIGKAGWQFAPEREDDLRNILAEAGIDLQNVYLKDTPSANSLSKRHMKAMPGKASPPSCPEPSANSLNKRHMKALIAAEERTKFSRERYGYSSADVIEKKIVEDDKQMTENRNESNPSRWTCITGSSRIP
jgi:hypothetical protein